MWIFAAEFAQEAQWLLSGSSTGELIAWDVAQAQTRLRDEPSHASSSMAVDASDGDGTLSGGSGRRDRRDRNIRTRSVAAHGSAIYCMAVNDADGLVVTGADEEIRFWKAPWRDADAGLGAADSELASPAPMAEIKIPQIEGARGARSPVAETNGLATLDGGRQLVAAAGDGNAYVFDVRSQQLVRSLDGQSMLHDTAVVERSGLVATAGEDGTCCLWDLRAKTCAQELNVGPANVLSALAVSADENWLAVGGAGEDGRGCLGMVHIASRMVTSCQATDHCGRVQNLRFSEANLLAAGDSAVLQFWTRNLAKLEVDIPTTTSSAYALCHNATTGLVAVAGVDNCIDVFSADRTLLLSLAA